MAAAEVKRQAAMERILQSPRPSDLVSSDDEWGYRDRIGGPLLAVVRVTVPRGHQGFPPTPASHSTLLHVCHKPAACGCGGDFVTSPTVCDHQAFCNHIYCSTAIARIMGAFQCMPHACSGGQQRQLPRRAWMSRQQRRRPQPRQQAHLSTRNRQEM